MVVDMYRLRPWRVGLEEKALREVVKLERHRVQKRRRILEDLRPGCLNPEWEVTSYLRIRFAKQPEDWFPGQLVWTNSTPPTFQTRQ